MKRFGIIGTVVLLYLVGTTGPAYAQRGKQKDKQTRHEEQAKPQKQQGPAHPQKEQQQQQRPPGWDRGKKVGWGDCNVPPGQAKGDGCRSGQQQQQLITQQQRRIVQYRQLLDQQQQRRLAIQQQTALLQQQNRSFQYRLQTDYLERMRQQQIRVDADRQHDYARDPFFYTASTYRYNRGSRYYETNQYGADLLSQAVNSGYHEGFRTGEADRQDRWRSSYSDAYAYQDANYGYMGYYVDRDEYNYYFREGFHRGYEDGFGSRTQYGSNSNGSFSVLGAILNQILGLQALR